MSLKIPCLFAVAAVLAVTTLTQPLSAETKQERDARMQWWREARFGMFIHWGIYSVPAGTYLDRQIPGIGEWIMLRGKIPVPEYASYASRFNPVKFDADEWVRLAKSAGMRYIVITSKHHDGFAMFKSQASPYNVVDATPFKRDVIKEISEACRREGMKLGLYYSQAQDWHHPGGAARYGHWDPSQDGDMDVYIDQIAVPQVREILSNYGPIAILWWDTPENMNEQRAARLFPLTKLQPGIITNDRLGGGFGGDLSTPEQFIPATGIPGKDWEACMTMNDTWGFKSYDNNWKSPADLIRGLADAASKGGNFLLNVGPTQEGLIPQPSVERLDSIGHWMAKYGESIYATSAGPFPYLKWGRATRNGQTLYLHVFSWPSTGLLRVPLTNHVKKAWLLADAGTRLAARRTASHIEIQLPAEAPDLIDSVIALEIEGQPSPLPVPSLGKPGNASSSYGPGFTANLAFDGQPETCWRAGKGQKSAWLEVTFDKPYRVGAVSLVEGWEVESYIRRFRLQCKDRGQWKTIFEGTRIGRSLTKTFDAVTARTFRLDILEATDAPRIEEMQLFMDE